MAEFGRFDDDYVRHIRAGEVFALDWDKLRALRGVAKTLWLLFLTPRIPYRPMTEDLRLERVEFALEPELRAARSVARSRAFSSGSKLLDRYLLKLLRKIGANLFVRSS